ncbi:hypothetical protein CDAR_254991 [Caerostris darwini]|uniref:Ycf15 n=1 Tax=Caerostris darwini TaxID=1538125 RepID=A0AAV4VBU8_9ARAC|nr:hypothetical protein CDAR_254991 [Caerostris darwini]
MSVNSCEFQTKIESGNSASTAISIWLNSTAFMLQSRQKDRTKRSVWSSTTIRRVYMLSVVLSNVWPIKTRNCFHIRHILPQKRLLTALSMRR